MVILSMTSSWSCDQLHDFGICGQWRHILWSTMSHVRYQHISSLVANDVIVGYVIKDGQQSESGGMNESAISNHVINVSHFITWLNVITYPVKNAVIEWLQVTYDSIQSLVSFQNANWFRYCCLFFLQSTKLVTGYSGGKLPKVLFSISWLV